MATWTRHSPCAAVEAATLPAILHHLGLPASYYAGLLTKVSARASWGFEGETPPPLQRFAVELDQRFITEMAHTAALFSELFEPSGRKTLLKVSAGLESLDALS